MKEPSSARRYKDWMFSVVMEYAERGRGGKEGGGEAHGGRGSLRGHNGHILST